MTPFSFSAEKKARIGVLISGRGSNMLALAEAARHAGAPYEIALVLSNEPDAKGIEAARHGNRLSDVSGAIQDWVEQHGFSVVRQFVGHGIGRKLHEDPPVPNYTPVERNPRRRKGMVLAIEPMVNLGSEEVVVADDGWTASAIDGRASAHYEHVVGITDGDPDILTTMEDQLGYA